MYLQLSTVFTFNSCIYFILLIFASTVQTYNINTNDVKLFSSPKSHDHKLRDYFGLSVALYTDGREFLVLVGAPKANSSELRNVIEPGVVYRCTEDRNCSEWILDRSGNGFHKKYHTLNQIIDNAWTGATIAIENKTNPAAVVCAPRWKQNIVNINRPNWYMNGACYLKRIKDLNSFDSEAENQMIPLINFGQQIISTHGVGIYNFGMGQSGFSLHMTSNDLGFDLALGSPGVYNWKGSSVLVQTSFGNSQKTIIPSIKDEIRIRGGDYFGYSITSGCYFRKDEEWYASGAPRNAEIYGAVLIYGFPSNYGKRLIVKRILSGQQHGEYFGAALASCDLNNDGQDELIVGAPLWNKDVDEGRVYIYSAHHNENFEVEMYEGEAIKGRFGSSIMCLGDIDYDGYADLAIGAPYEADSGAVYIFNGNSNGFPKAYSQKIMGSQFGDGIRGFGISISEPRDINADHYSDIAIGAYLSEQVILLQSKPVVTVTTNLTHVEKKKLLRNSTSFLIELCSYYDGAFAPDKLRIMQFLRLDPMYGRITFTGERTSENLYKLPGILWKSKTMCDRLSINLKENIQNVIDPIEISSSLELEEISKTETEGNEKSFTCTSCAVINKLLSKTEDSLKFPFAVDCGDDDVCTSDIKLTLSSDLPSNNTYIIGSKPTIKLTVNVSNNGEPAYQAKIYVYIPEFLSLASVPPECMEGLNFNSTLEVICDVGNPLRKNKILILEIDASYIRSYTDSVDLWATVVTQSDEKNRLDDTDHLKISFDLHIDIAIAGKAQEDLYSYFDGSSEKQVESIQFHHIYEVQKFGISPIEEAVLMITVPIYWEDSTRSVEIININQTIGYMDGQRFYCDFSNHTGSSLISLSQKPRPNVLYLSKNTHERFTIEEETSLSMPAENRSLYINCTSTNIKCKRVECRLGPFKSSMSVAKLSLILDLQLFNFNMDIMDGKDIIYFVSEGNVMITDPMNVTQIFGHKPDSTRVATTFLGSPIVERMKLWILILSVFLGIILLILLILGLIKLGFFNRKKKEELEALKAESDKVHGITLETTSSREVLDQE